MRTFSLIMIALILAVSCKKIAPEKVDECYPSVVLNGVTYSLDPCTITETMTKGAGDKQFTVTIKTSSIATIYGFNVRGYGEGFPTYSILGGRSGGASGSTQLALYFSDNALAKGTYDGYLPINVYLGSGTGNDTNFLKLKIKLTVK